MMMVPVTSLTVLVLTLQVRFSPAAAQWANDWDQEAKMECAENQIMSYMGSIHDNYFEDRRWQFLCDEAPVPVKDCYWTDYLNNFDQPFTFSCGRDQVVAGMNSFHSNRHEDRRFQLKCCTWSVPKRIQKRNCGFTDFINDWDHEMVFIVPGGSYIRGMCSIHDDYYEDRKWRIELCDS